MTRTALTGVRDEGNRPGVASPPWKKRIHEALATPWKAFARSPLGLASILGQAADQPPFRRAKCRPHPLAVARRQRS